MAEPGFDPRQTSPRDCGLTIGLFCIVPNFRRGRGPLVPLIYAALVPFIAGSLPLIFKGDTCLVCRKCCKLIHFCSYFTWFFFESLSFQP